MMLRRYAIAALSAIFLSLVVLAQPQAAGGDGATASDWAAHENGRMRLISASSGVGERETLRLGLHFQLEPGWKIYWRSPGEAGYPPKVDWSGSKNLAEANLRWPVPHRFELFGLQTFGYGGEVVLPIVARVERAGEGVTLNASVDYLTCEEICIPRKAQLSVTLPPDSAQPSEHAYLIDRFRARVPGDGAGSGLSLDEAALSDGDETPVLSLAVTSTAEPFDAPDAVVEGADGYAFGKPIVALKDGGKRAVLDLPIQADPTAEGKLEGRQVTVTVFDGERGLERDIALRTGDIGAGGALLPGLGEDSGDGLLRLAGMLGLAVLGGLILNLMPCVLPVLSLKLLKVVGHGGRELGHVRASFLASAAGILVSFLVLAGGAIALKSAGAAVGWGMQFQHPAFLVGLTLVVTLFACNLFGFFEIPLPRFIADSLGGQHQGHEGMAGHFLTGALATLLATPCSAPFLGTAIAFALSRGAIEILAIFIALGIGLALPYLAVAAVPSVAARMPRPGRWMLTVKKVLGLALAGTAVWLLTVLAAQDGTLAAGAVGGLMAALIAVLGLKGLAPGQLRRAVPILVAVIGAAAFAAPPGLGSAPQPAKQTAASDWQTLDRTRIQDMVDAGKVVFVDVTADWCITCKVNKAAVINTETVQARLDGKDVVRMRGDWTRPSDEIAEYLASFGRYGIPFNVVYGPNAPKGIALPEILTKSAVLDAIDTARAG
ncbi:protein-disulfide reductase DsbD family protein [Ferruginivarius sediminum]|nr:protein-disulfide reductase DsbD domain-containing protein [Ferruginivarius sediminum]